MLDGQVVQFPAPADVWQGSRLVLGGVAPLPWRRHSAEELLVGTRLDDEIIQEVSCPLVFRGSALAILDTAGNLVRGERRPGR